MAYKALPPQSVLKQLFDYDPESGLLRWKERPTEMFGDKKQPASWNAAIWNGKNAGKVACSLMSSGYQGTTLWRRKVLAHRIIWKWVCGVEPHDIDHINGNPSDNRLSNLRNVSHADNGKNLKRRKNNTSGATGVYRDGRRGNWVASISPDRRSIYLGAFDSFDEAVAARRAAEVKFEFHKNHGQR